MTDKDKFNIFCENNWKQRLLNQFGDKKSRKILEDALTSISTPTYEEYIQILEEEYRGNVEITKSRSNQCKLLAYDLTRLDRFKNLSYPTSIVSSSLNFIHNSQFPSTNLVTEFEQLEAQTSISLIDKIFI